MGIQGPGPQYFATGPSTITPINSVARKETDRKPASRVFRLDALAKALSVIATATWLAGSVAGWLGVSHSGIVSKRLNLSENFFDHLKAPSF